MKLSSTRFFLRLNTGSVPLSPQELRQALHPGDFSRFVDEYSINSKLLKEILNIDEPDFRMRDAELVIRYFAFRNFLQTYTGNLKPLLDRTTEYYNKNWKAEATKIDLQRRQFESALETTIAVFGTADAFRKWNGESFERQLNRAVFDVMMMYFVRPEISEAAIHLADSVVVTFKELCERNDTFRSSIEGTTKSINAILDRLVIWGNRLSKTLNIPISLPKLVDNHIILE